METPLILEDIACKHFFFVHTGFGVMRKDHWTYIYVTDEEAVIDGNCIFCTQKWHDNFISHI